VEPQLKLNLAIPNHAQLTAFSKIGLNGQFATRPAELDPPPEPEMLRDPLHSEERPALKPLKLNLATPTTAQLTASKALGANGPCATRPAEEDNKPAAEASSPKPPLEELLVEPAHLFKLAMRAHAQLTAS